ncbi:MAG: tetratricopeptide repeat protein [Bacteroidota bacterium]
MEEFFRNNDFEEQQTRASVREFENMLLEDSFFFIDLGKVEVIYNYYFQTNELHKARKLVDFALQSHPSSGALYYKLAKLEFEYGQYGNALGFIDTALSYSPLQIDYSIFKAEILVRLDRNKDSLDLMEEVLNISTRPEEIYMTMGNLAQISGDPVLSEEYYKRSLAIKPDFEEAVYELAFLLESEDRLTDSIALYEAYLDDYPYSEMVWYNLGVQYRKTGNYERAIECFDYCLAINDELSAAYFQKGQLQMDLGRYQDALQSFLEANSLTPYDVHTLFHVADCYENLNMFRDAIRYYTKTSQVDPDFLDAFIGIGYCLEKQEKFMEAIHYYEKAFKLDDENPDVCMSIATCEFKLGNKHSSYMYLERAIQLNPQDVSIWQDWSSLLHEYTQYEGAISFLEEGLKYNPSEAELYFQLAAYCLETGHRSKGLNYLEHGLLLDYQAHYYLFHVDASLKHEPEVMELIRIYKV